MGRESGIQWTDATFNPWRGCTKVSPGCANCYAERQSHRNPAVLGKWGPGAPRVSAADSYWRQPELWCKQARRERRRIKVFCASLADVFDAEAPRQARNRLWSLITSTSGQIWGFDQGGLDWLILTKRPERIGDVLREDGVRPSFFHDNGCWVGVSVESQEFLRRFWSVRHWSRVPWISAEPLLGPLTMPEVLQECRWIVAGGESGPKARPLHPDWVRSIRDQCQAAAVPFFWKQWGEWMPADDSPMPEPEPKTVLQGTPGECTVMVRPGTTICWVDADGPVKIVGDDGRFTGDSPRGVCMARVGKAKAGRLLDGREWSEFPEVAHA